MKYLEISTNCVNSMDPFNKRIGGFASVLFNLKNSGYTTDQSKGD